MTPAVNLVRTVPSATFIQGNNYYYLCLNNTYRPSVFPLYLFSLSLLSIFRCHERDLYEHFFWQFNRVTGVGGVVVWITMVGYCRQNTGISEKWTGRQWHCRDQRWPRIRTGSDWIRTEQRWADCEIFQSETSPDPIKLNPIQSWSAEFLKIISPIQSWSANVKSCIFILPHEARELLELFCLSPIMIGWRQNTSSSAFVSWGKIDSTAFRHFQNLTRKCLLSIRGKSTAGVILPLVESSCLDWSSDNDNTLGLA